MKSSKAGRNIKRVGGNSEMDDTEGSRLRAENVADKVIGALSRNMSFTLGATLLMSRLRIVSSVNIGEMTIEMLTQRISVCASSYLSFR